MKPINLAFRGPYKVFSQSQSKDTDLLSEEQSKVGRTPGIYLWVVNNNGMYVINYIGKSQTCVFQRTYQHVGNFFGLSYNIYNEEVLKNPQSIEQCTKESLHSQYYVYSGKKEFDQKHRERNTQMVELWTNDFAKFTEVIRNQFEYLRIFYAPIERGTNDTHEYNFQLRKVESMLIRYVKKQGSMSANFLDNGLHGVIDISTLKEKNPGEIEIQITMSFEDDCLPFAAIKNRSKITYDDC